jgi:hypothetical protein
VKACPGGLAPVGSVKAVLNDALDCLPNNDVSSCPRPTLNTTALASLCVPAAGSAKDVVAALYKALGEGGDLSTQVVNLLEAKNPLIIMAFVVFLSTLAYIYLLRFLAKPVLYISMFALFLFGALGGAWIFMMKDNYTPVEGVVNNYQYC